MSLGSDLFHKTQLKAEESCMGRSGASCFGSETGRSERHFPWLP